MSAPRIAENATVCNEMQDVRHERARQALWRASCIALRQLLDTATMRGSGMKIGVAMVGIAACWSANATPAKHFVDVEYEGTISSITGTIPQYSVGDHISGSLRIDLRLAPPDDEPSTLIGRYAISPSDGVSRFVTGYAPAHEFSADMVALQNPLDGRDAFTVEDSQFGLSPLSHGRSLRSEDTLSLTARGSNFLDDVELVQSLDLRGADVGGGLISRTREIYERGEAVLGSLVEGLAELRLQRFTVRPGRCSA
jgi:hypothetical protein